jgi:CBS domain-containing protein
MIMKQVEDVMRTQIMMVSPSDSISRVARLLISRDVESAVVIDAGEAVGIVSERDLLQGSLPTIDEILEDAETLYSAKDLMVIAEEHGSRPVSSVMTKHITSIPQKEPIIKAVATMLGHRHRRLPVTGPEGDFVGIITQRDLLCALFVGD